MKAWLLAALACAACSTPAVKKDDPPPPPPPSDDEQTSVAWQKDHPLPPPDAMPVGMNWDKARKVALEYRNAPLKPCDFRRKTQAPAGVECIGKRAVLLGALVISMRRDVDTEETIVRIDIGRELVDEAWLFAIVDAGGFAVSPWTKPDDVGQSYSTFRVPIPVTKIVPETTRVIAKKEP